MKRIGQKLTLDLQTTYQIRVPGHLDDSWPDGDEHLTISVENDADNLPISTLTVCVDQATLQGLLRRLYALGRPLISVNWICDAKMISASGITRQQSEDSLPA